MTPRKRILYTLFLSFLCFVCYAIGLCASLLLLGEWGAIAATVLLFLTALLFTFLGSGFWYLGAGLGFLANGACVSIYYHIKHTGVALLEQTALSVLLSFALFALIALACLLLPRLRKLFVCIGYLGAIGLLIACIVLAVKGSTLFYGLCAFALVLPLFLLWGLANCVGRHREDLAQIFAVSAFGAFGVGAIAVIALLSEGDCCDGGDCCNTSDLSASKKKKN